MPFAGDRLAYHPAGDTQEALFEDDAPLLRELGVRSISTTELFANVSYVALNPGEGFGVLTAVDPTAARPPTIRDVALFATLPNDLGHVAGVISATPQTPLSHINLKAKQNDTPNAYVRGAPAHAKIAPLLGQVVRYEVRADDLALAPGDARRGRRPGWSASAPSSRRRRRAISPRRRSSTSTSSATATSQRVGAKAANVAELRKMLPAGVAPDGYAIPFAFYDRFMRDGGFYEDARRDHLRRGAARRPGRARGGARHAAQEDEEGRPARPSTRPRSAALQAKLPGGHADPLPLLDEQRGPRGLQRRRSLRLLHAPARRGRPEQDGQAGVGVAVELPRLRRARLPPHRPPRRGDGRARAPELRRRARQRRGGDEEPLRPGLAGLLRQRPGRRVARHEPRSRTRRPTSCSSRRSASRASTRRSTSAARR